MPGGEGVEGGLRDANVRFDADDDDGGFRGEGGGEGRGEHAEEGFVVED